MPFNKFIEWIKKEEKLGVSDPQNAVLSTVTPKGIPHSRVVSIREIQSDSLIFFTQKKTRKVTELLNNSNATFNFYFILPYKRARLF